MISEGLARTALRQVIDPEFGVDIVDMNMVRSIEIEEDTVHVAVVLTVPFCPLAGYMVEVARQAVASLPDVRQVTVEVLDELWEPPGQGYDWD